jgi:hypothetical protein
MSCLVAFILAAQGLPFLLPHPYRPVINVLPHNS